jgi:hypothetical protein
MLQSELRCRIPDPVAPPPKEERDAVESIARRLPFFAPSLLALLIRGVQSHPDQTPDGVGTGCMAGLLRVLADLATSPGQAAAAAASATATAPSAAATAASAAASAASAASAPLRNLFPDVGRAGVFLVEDVEGPQADVGDFFFTEGDLGQRGIPGRRIRDRHSGRRGCPARERQRHAHDSDNRYGLFATLSLRSLLLARHCLILPYLPADVRRSGPY